MSDCQPCFKFRYSEGPGDATAMYSTRPPPAVSPGHYPEPLSLAAADLPTQISTVPRRLMTGHAVVFNKRMTAKEVLIAAEGQLDRKGGVGWSSCTGGSVLVGIDVAWGGPTAVLGGNGMKD